MFISDVKLVTEFISNLWLTPEEETIVLHASVLKGRLQCTIMACNFWSKLACLRILLHFKNNRMEIL